MNMTDGLCFVLSCFSLSFQTWNGTWKSHTVTGTEALSGGGWAGRVAAAEQAGWAPASQGSVQLPSGPQPSRGMDVEQRAPRPGLVPVLVVLAASPQEVG